MTRPPDRAPDPRDPGCACLTILVLMLGVIALGALLATGGLVAIRLWGVLP